MFMLNLFESQNNTYWLDRAEINWRDSLIEKINQGILFQLGDRSAELVK